MSNNERLSQIHTMWSVVRRAHEDDTLEARSAQQQMVDRYGSAVRRYLLGALRNEAAAEEVLQEFSLRFLQGDYASADPERGSFRSFLKTILFRMVAEHYRKLKRDKIVPLGSELVEPAVLDPQQSEREFAQVWSDELLKKSWDALAAEEKQTGRPLFAVMRQRVEHPELKSPQLAQQVAKQLGKPVSAANMRVMLHRARERFAQLLLDEVANSLDQPTREEIENELIELGLLEYCRPALEQLEKDEAR